MPGDCTQSRATPCIYQKAETTFPNKEVVSLETLQKPETLLAWLPYRNGNGKSDGKAQGCRLRHQSLLWLTQNVRYGYVR